MQKQTEKRDQKLDALLVEAGSATKPPPPPAMGIPRQFFPKWLRTLLKSIALPFVIIDDSMQKVAKKIIRPPFKREGSCRKRGNCCHYVLIAYSDKFVGKLFYFWYTQVLGFYKRLPRAQIYEGKKMHVMGCRHLKKNGMCGDYHLRPLVCRQWPMIEYFGYPKVLKGCGYRPHPPYPDTPDDHLSGQPPSGGNAKLKVLQ